MRRIALFGALLILSVAPTRGQAFITSNSVGINYPSGFSQALQGVPYSRVFTPSPSGFIAPVTWSNTGSFPAGLTLNTSTGVLSGTPTGTGASTFTIAWADSATPPHGATSGSLSITVSALSSITVTPTGQSIQTAATLQMAAQCNWVLYSSTVCTNIVAWTATGAGTINASTGLLTAGGSAGTATPQAGLNSTTGSTTVAVVNNNPAPTITNSATLPTPACVVNFPCPSVQFTATGGSGTGYTWLITGTAPTGCNSSVSTSGLYSCTPTAAGNYNAFSVQVTDSLGAMGSKTFTQLVASPTSSTASVSSASVALGGQTQGTAIATFSDSSTQNVTAGTGGLRKVQQQSCTGGPPSCTITWNPPITAGDNIHLSMRQGADTTSAFSGSDPSSQTYSAVGVKNITSGDDIELFQTTNSAAIPSTTCTTAAAGAIECNGVEVAGEIASTSNIDGSPVNNNVSGATGTSDTTAALTTTNANDFLMDCANQVGSSTGWSALVPFTLFASQNRTGCQFEIVSSIQTALTAQLNWSTPAPATHSSIFAAFKAAGSGGAVWSTTPGTGNGNVNAAGQITGTAPGTFTVQFTYGGNTSNSVTVTVMGGATDTSLVINPSSGSGNTGSNPSAQFQAVGNVTGTSYTNSGTWASNNTTIATSLGNGAFKCNTNGSTGITVSFPSLTSGTATLQCNTISTTSLLSGCIVTGSAPTSTASVTGCNNSWPPSGWTLFCADGAEASTEPACSGVYPANNTTSVTMSRPHAGTHSFQGTFTGDAAEIGVFYGTGAFSNITYHSLYGSLWVREDSNAMFANSDFNWFYIYPAGSTGCPNGIGMDAELYNDNTDRSVLTSSIQASGLGLNTGSGGSNCPGQFLDNGFTYTMPAGQWVQYEFLFTPSTIGTPPLVFPAPNCNNLTPSSPSCGNGTLQVWVNGSLKVNHLNVNTNGSLAMSPGGYVIMGGLITSFVSLANEGLGRCTSFSLTGGGPCPGTQPGTGAPQPFVRNIDDIILIWK